MQKLLNVLWDGKGRGNYLFIIAQRYLRIVVPLLFGLGFSAWIVPAIGSVYNLIGGANNWEIGTYFETSCQTKFWANLLLINNLYPSDLSKHCLPLTWYLATEF